MVNATTAGARTPDLSHFYHSPLLRQALDEPDLGAVEAVGVLLHGGPLQDLAQERPPHHVGQPVARAASALVAAPPETVAVEGLALRGRLLALGRVGEPVGALVTLPLRTLEQVKHE